MWHLWANFVIKTFLHPIRGEEGRAYFVSQIQNGSSLPVFFMNEQDMLYSARSQSSKQQSGSKARKRVQEERQKTAISILLVVLVGAGLVCGGFFLAREYLHRTEQHVSNQINELMLENRRIENEIKETMQLFKDELESYKEEIQQVRSEMNAIYEELELAGESLTGTDATRQSLQERMAELDKQLAALREQLRKLEEAVLAL
jgi:chromosome segregation ATPase